MNCLFCSKISSKMGMSNNISYYSYCYDCQVTYIKDIETDKLVQYYYPFKINDVEYRYIIQCVGWHDANIPETLVYRMKDGNEEKFILQWFYSNPRINPKNVAHKIKTYLVFS